MSGLAALIFDVDGTLADTERDGHRVAFNEAFARKGLDWHWSEALYGRLLEIPGGKERMRHFMRHYVYGEEPPADAAALITELHADKNRIYNQLFSEGRLGLRPGVDRLIREARAAGVPLAIATTSARENVLALLCHTLGTEAPGWFDPLASADEVPEKKPSPAVYEYVLARLGVDPGRCLVLEDSENGLRAARGAGLRTLITVNAYTRDGDYRDAELVLDHLGEPDRPFTILGGRSAGRAADRRYVDLDLLEGLTVDN